MPRAWPGLAVFSCSLFLQLLALLSTQGLRFSDKGGAVKLASCSAVQPDLFESGQNTWIRLPGEPPSFSTSQK